jgi:hypothetical protein
LEVLERPRGGGIIVLNLAEYAPTSGSFAGQLRVYGGAITLLLALSQIAPHPTYAAHQQSEERDEMRRMNEQIQELQLKVTKLEARLNAKAAGAPSEAVDSPLPVTTASTTTPPFAPPLPDQDSQADNSLPSVSLRLFGDVGYQASDQKGATNSFHIGTLDLFMTGALTSRVSILGEVLFISQPNNGFGVDVERLLLQYKQNDYFNFAVGRYHSSIGYYNTAFHQGAWFQTTIDRPFMYAFDDQGGFLPLQEVGATINGQIPSGSLGLNYVAEIGNGRAHVLGSDPAQNFQDTNNGKSFNLALYSRPTWRPGLQTGFSIYHDHLTFSNHIDHDELISTAYVVYTDSNYEFLNEAMLVRHTQTSSGAPGVFHTPGFYTQFSRRFGKYRPYVRYAYVNAGVAEPVYGNPLDGPVVGRRNGPTLGIRFDMNDHAAFKLEYDHLSQRGQKSFDALESQFSFAF